MYSPLEEFSITILATLNINKTDLLGISNSLVLAVVTLYYIVLVLNPLVLIGPIGLISMSTISIDYYLEVIYSIYLEIYSYLLYYIMANLLGLLEESIVISGMLFINIYYSLSIILYITILGYIKNDLYLLRNMGLNILLDSFVLFIEYISYTSRILSLSIRISFNIICGHLLIKILMAILITILYIKGMGLLFVMIYLLINTIYLLEIYISYLQGFIYSILLYIYGKEILLS